NLQAAFLAPGKAGGLVLADVGQAKLVQDRLGALPALATVGAAAETAQRRNRLENGQDVLLDGQLAEDAGLLGQVAHAEAGAAEHGELGHVLAVEGDLAAVG